MRGNCVREEFLRLSETGKEKRDGRCNVCGTFAAFIARSLLQGMDRGSERTSECGRGADDNRSRARARGGSRRERAKRQERSLRPVAETDAGFICRLCAPEETIADNFMGRYISHRGARDLRTTRARSVALAFVHRWCLSVRGQSGL